MNFIVNLVPIKKGGGQQVASNFVNFLVERKDFKPIFLVTKGSYISSMLTNLGVSDVIEINDFILSRFFFENFGIRKVIQDYNIKLIYSLFGPGLRYPGTKSITGCAYSNLFFPEIDFWKNYSLLRRIKLKLIDIYRLNSTLKSDAIIFENKAMKTRATKLFNYPENRTKLILPSISENEKKNINQKFEKRLNLIDQKKFNTLMLSGWHKNKNIEIVPHVLKRLKEFGVEDVNFVITVPRNHPESIKLLRRAKRMKVDTNIVLFDSVNPDEVPFLFEKIDTLALFSKLESFSNNIIEAWTYKKPLIISNEEWSRAICKEYAVYVDRDNSRDIARKLLKIKTDKIFSSKLIKSYSEVLNDYPSPQEKVDLQLQFITEIYNEQIN